MAALGDIVARRGVLLAALAAAAAGAPSLFLPFLSDDWLHLIDVADGELLRTSYGYFRPLCSLSYWIDWQIWGRQAAPFHLTNVLLASVCAALVVVVVRRYTGDAALAGITGLLFALHPYHVAPVAWVAARSDLLSAVVVLLAAWSYDRWRERPASLPFAALALYEVALLAKESAVVLPGALIVIGLLDRSRRPGAAEWLRGFAPMFAVAMFHFVVLRSVALGGVSLGHLDYIGHWRGSLLSYGVTSIVAPPPEVFQANPRGWGLIAVAVAGLLLVVVRLRTGRIPPVLWPAVVVFPALLGPSLISFQLRFFFLPAAAAMLALAALLRGAGARWGGALAGLLLAGWALTAVDLWSGQRHAAEASRKMVDGLVEATSTKRGQTIVALALPHRVHGVPIVTDHTRLVRFVSGSDVTVRTASEFDYPTPRSDALIGPIESRQGEYEIRLGVERRPHSRLVLPLFEGRGRVDEPWASVVRDGSDAVTVRTRPGPDRQFLLWKEGELVELP